MAPLILEREPVTIDTNTLFDFDDLAITAVERLGYKGLKNNIDDLRKSINLSLPLRQVMAEMDIQPFTVIVKALQANKLS